MAPRGNGGGERGTERERGGVGEGDRKSIDKPCAHDGRAAWPLEGTARSPPSDDTSIP